jgi:hypothetical protein
MGATMPSIFRPGQPLTGSQPRCKENQPAALPEQSVHALLGQRHDVVRRAVAVGDVGMIAEVDDGKAGEALHDGAENGKSPVA